MRQFCSFSEAIREGAKLTPRGSRFVLLDDNGGTCAVGAGAAAIGLPTLLSDIQTAFFPFNSTLHSLRETYPYLRAPAECPGCRDHHLDLLSMVAELFDVYDWTREAIADWLEREEEKLGFVTLVEFESSASRSELSLDPQPVASRSGV